ncbi:hypothetical protein CCUS01_02891 [Colletotrichum cuscutae]|uniref:Uncharacterized protein n=1 Tax=Colletotrichum cuscutae TaxID=1209917 RepID=A0AAJ0DMJ7_9PEZI|nr:hypothetical protein CCUS01_02891 [Colletotrichum cuscutae]
MKSVLYITARWPEIQPCLSLNKYLLDEMLLYKRRLGEPNITEDPKPPPKRPYWEINFDRNHRQTANKHLAGSRNSGSLHDPPSIFHLLAHLSGKAVQRFSSKVSKTTERQLFEPDSTPFVLRKLTTILGGGTCIALAGGTQTFVSASHTARSSGFVLTERMTRVATSPTKIPLGGFLSPRQYRCRLDIMEFIVQKLEGFKKKYGNIFCPHFSSGETAELGISSGCRKAGAREYDIRVCASLYQWERRGRQITGDHSPLALLLDPQSYNIDSDYETQHLFWCKDMNCRNRKDYIGRNANPYPRQVHNQPASEPTNRRKHKESNNEVVHSGIKEYKILSINNLRLSGTDIFLDVSRPL